MDFKKAFSLNLPSKTDGSQTYTAENLRISVITPRLFRVEFSKSGGFTDMPTQKVWCRQLEKASFKVKRSGSFVIIGSLKYGVCVDCKTGRIAYAVANGVKVRDFKKDNLGGTYRTLDGTTGAIPLGTGIVSKSGAALFDDSDSLLLNEDGTVSPRRAKAKDIYVFAYGRDYRAAVRDFLRLTGGVPMIPRFALGNWWSRYKAYTQKEYLDLIERFEKERLPLTVATIDMDWHWVDLKKQFSSVPGINKKDISSGWTGYSWNTELFPDYKEMFDKLKERDLKITMNLHPADGVRFFEDMYDEVAKYMGVDPASKAKIPFDCGSPRYMEAYFELIHHKYEEDGVDFWWIDWQQGKRSSIPGLDPLWALNHYHYIDNCRGGKRGLILSRYAEPGSQRYPVGFSGDTFIYWSCLRFQPYFTSTASNIGYTWWSHDIGGHQHGKKDDELYARWVQFGVFSPVNRLHSTSNEFMGKEPWKYGVAAREVAGRFLRLRRRLIPYLYTMNRRTYADMRALCEPMYYAYPNEEEAYCCKNEYLFGSELIAAPITSPENPKTSLAGVKVWLPRGTYIDMFTGRRYEGGRVIEMFRPLESFPLLAKEGAIIPLDMNETENGAENPAALEIFAVSGNGSFTLYEDDGETQEYQNGVFAETPFEIEKTGGDVRFSILPVRGSAECTVSSRAYKISFFDIASALDISVKINGKKASANIASGAFLSVELAPVKPAQSVEIKLSGVTLRTIDRREEYIETVSKYKLANEYKKSVFTCGVDSKMLPKCPQQYLGPIKEINCCL